MRGKTTSLEAWDPLHPLRTNWLSKLWKGGCFVAGTKITLSDMPRSGGLEQSLWGNDAADHVSGSALAAGSFAEDIGFAPLTYSSSLPSSDSSLLQIPIEDVPLGARVPTKNPRPWEYDDSLPEPDEATWQVVKFTVHRKDGGVVDAELLRPNSWINANGLEVGRLLAMDIEELQIEGFAAGTVVEADFQPVVGWVKPTVIY